MEITLTPEQEKFIAEAVASGQYASPEQVLQASLTGFQEQEAWKAYAKAKIAKGLEDLAAGRVVTGDQLKQRLSDRRRKQA